MTLTHTINDDEGPYDGYPPQDSFLGYCPYCKNEIFDFEDYKITHTHKTYHMECFEQKHNIRKELRFN